MPLLIDLSGKSFGHLRVESRVGTAANGKALWRCVCRCGNQTVVNGSNLRDGHTKSCGCAPKGPKPRPRLPRLDISAESVRERFNYDPLIGRLTRRIAAGGQPIGADVGHLRCDGYLEANVLRHKYKVHWLIWLHVHGHWPSPEIDHANGNRIDNRLRNLCEVTRMQNLQNLRGPKRTNKSGYLGVFARGDKFRAQIRAENRTVMLGTFATAAEASQAYQAAKQRLHFTGLPSSA